ncbi:MAG: hypothetical protein K0A99_05335 [Desulfoarculaceae bacterium]|nr:hypothetical protein [Desulfoarculaceae bacterium]
MMRQKLRQKNVGLIFPKGLWRVAGKVFLLLCPLLLLVNFWLSSSADRIAVEILAAEEGRYLMMDEHIKLRAERARLYSPGYLNEVAASQLALYVPEKNQVTRL